MKFGMKVMPIDDVISFYFRVF